VVEEGGGARGTVLGGGKGLRGGGGGQWQVVVQPGGEGTLDDGWPTSRTDWVEV
jgi:hypothetical protein